MDRKIPHLADAIHGRMITSSVGFFFGYVLLAVRAIIDYLFHAYIYEMFLSVQTESRTQNYCILL